jgi:SAM-dependent methyltransferase
VSKFTYTGSELDLFAHAVNWKLYWSSLLQDFLKGDVLEVGAGKGNNTRHLISRPYSRWVSLEPDYELAEHLRKNIQKNHHYENYEVINGTITSLGSDYMFDTILYIDVLEHIEDDKEELKKASSHLKPGGHLIILSPALPVLYSEFDAGIGHFRRYTKKTFKNILPASLKVERLMYLDTIGLLVSMGNRFFLRQKMPNLKQIRLWDRFIIPCSKHVDRLTGYRTGKSMLAILSLNT